jgi:hypothetical protein
VATFIFVTLITILGILASSAAIHHTKRYQSTETSALQYVVDKLKRLSELHSDAAKSQKTHGPKTLIPISALEEGLSKKTLIADRLSLIRRMRESHVKVNLSALQQMTMARESSIRWLALPSSATSLSMMLGLLGTVLGLSIMVQHIGAALPKDPFDVAQVEKWRTEFATVLDAMRTGFSSTLAGLSFAILLSFLNQRLAHAQAAFLDRLDRFTTEDLLPATVPGSQDESVLEAVSLQMESNFKRLDDVANNNQDILKELSSIEKGFIQIVDTIRQTTRSEASDRMQSLVGKFSEALEQMAKVNQSVVNISDAMPKLLDRVEKTNTASISRIDRLIESYEHQRSLIQWPLQVKLVFGFLVALNLFFIWRAIFS